jgi:hypothetical protein
MVGRWLVARAIRLTPRQVELPIIVCLCGSTRYPDAFREANLRETLAGRIVVTIGCNMRTDPEFADLAAGELERIKAGLDDLHKHKIRTADEVYVLNVGGYIGDSTRSEIEYALELGKPVRWLEQPSGELLAWFEAVTPR